MSSPAGTAQRIVRLAPLAEVMARLDAIAAPVVAREQDTAAASGATLAADLRAPKDLPAAPAALRDGWAVASELVLDAGPYAPVPLSPPPVWVEAGDGMPAGTDAVLPADAVAVTKAGAEAHASAVPGGGVVLARSDLTRDAVLRRAGQRLRPADAAVAAAAGIRRVSVRAPRIRIFSVNVPTRSAADTISPILARAVEAEGCVAQVAQAANLESVFTDRANDAIVTIGGTGAGKRDAAATTLARAGKLELHGFGIAPGETAALGSVDGRPVLMLPGRLDAALAVFLIVGRALLTRLAGGTGTEPGETVKLTRKVTSTVGIAEMVLVRRTGEGAEPLGTGAFSFQAIAQADGWILIPPESEGFAAGANVEMKLLP